ncbi:MAG: uL22 family ribosomal protein, partial [Candidatus Peribacteraceae bacterium]|nr:uL22 family ribosomal protein [Candidatus Peribacteraceae bacterium]
EAVLKSAVANAVHNSKQREEDLVIKTIIVNQGQAYRRGVPMARGRTRPMRKFLSHLEIVLGVGTAEDGSKEVGKVKNVKKVKNGENASQKGKKPVKESTVAKSRTKKTSSTSTSSSTSPTS